MALRNRLHPGEIYGRLTVLGATKERNNSQVVYICVCSCGTFTTATANLLHNKHKQSCGCLRRDKPNGITHGLSKTREYHIWAEMKKRCTNPSQKTFSYYGGRGITFCERWKSFENFLHDLGPCPDGFTLDRIDPNGNYEPNNCRWASRKDQSRNRRSNRFIVFNNETHCLAEWAEIKGITRECLKQRLKRNWPLDKALGGK